MTTFDMLGLAKPLLSALEKQGFTTPTPIQNQAIPHLMNGHDLMGVAQTGGGKTAAFALPMINRLLEENEKTVSGKPRCVIMAPTRELAQQIGVAIRDFTKGQKVFHTVLYGGAPYKMQLQQLQRGVHIVVATPGRLMDHMKRGSLSCENVHTLVLDEADRMLDMGFIHDVKHVADAMPEGTQTVMYSATMSKSIRALAAGLLNKPKHVEVERENSVADTIDHRVMHTKQKDKQKLLSHILESEEVTKTIIFTRTKSMADRLNETLRAAGHNADVIHGDRVQAARQKVLRAFRNSVVTQLVATDVAARGIDVSDISHVINYDMPLEGDSYVHRIGRTGRAGQKGIALSFCTEGDSDLLSVIERTIKQKIAVDDTHPFHQEPAPQRSLGKPQQRKRFGGKGNGAPKGNGKGGGNRRFADGENKGNRRFAEGDNKGGNGNGFKKRTKPSQGQRPGTQAQRPVKAANKKKKMNRAA